MRVADDRLLSFANSLLRTPRAQSLSSLKYLTSWLREEAETGQEQRELSSLLDEKPVFATPVAPLCRDVFAF